MQNEAQAVHQHLLVDRGKRSAPFTRDLVVTIAVVGAAAALRVLLAPVLYDRAAFILFTLAVMLSAWMGGWLMGAIATGLASFVGVWLFVAPFDMAKLHDIQDVAQTALFAVTGCGISLLAGQLQRARSSAEHEARNATHTRDELSDLLESISEGFQALDSEFRVIYMNHAAELIAGRPSAGLIGSSVWNEFPADISVEVEQQLRSVMRLRTPVSSENFDESRRRWFLINVYPSGDGVSVLSRDITGRKKAETDRERLVKELQDALGHVRTLRGLIPICAWCKRIRNDEGYWQQLEAYLRDHSEADFTHGMCPDCAKEYSK